MMSMGETFALRHCRTKGQLYKNNNRGRKIALEAALPLFEIEGDFVKINNMVDEKNLNKKRFDSINPYLLEEKVKELLGADFKYSPNKIILNNYYCKKMTIEFDDPNYRSDATWRSKPQTVIVNKAFRYNPETLIFNEPYSFNKPVEAKTIISTRTLNFGGESEANNVLCERAVCLSDQARVNSIRSYEGIYLYGKSQASELNCKTQVEGFMRTSINLKNKSFASKIKSNGKVVLNDASSADHIVSQKEVRLDDRSSAKVIISKNCQLRNTSKANSIIAKCVMLSENTMADSIYAQNYAILTDKTSVGNVKSPVVVLRGANTSVKNIEADNNLYINGNGKVERIKVKGTQIIIDGQAQISDKIHFINGPGKVVLLADDKLNFPRINSSDVNNGEVIHCFDRRRYVIDK